MANLTRLEQTPKAREPITAIDHAIYNSIEALESSEQLEILSRIHEISKRLRVITSEKEKLEFQKELNNLKDRLVRSYQKYIISFLIKYFREKTHVWDDLIQEGNIGVLTAIEKFDFGKNANFSTYASWWIYSKMKRYGVQNNSIVDIPVHVMTKYGMLIRWSREYFELHQEMPSNTLSAKFMGLSLANYNLLKKAMRPFEFDTPSDTDTDLIFDIPQIDSEFAQIDSQELDWKILREKLFDDEFKLLIWYYGFFGVPKKSLDEIRIEYGISKSAVQYRLKNLHERLRFILNLQTKGPVRPKP